MSNKSSSADWFRHSSTMPTHREISWKCLHFLDLVLILMPILAFSFPQSGMSGMSGFRNPGTTTSLGMPTPSSLMSASPAYQRKCTSLYVRSGSNNPDRKSFKRFWEKELYRQPELASVYDILLGIEIACRHINRLMRRVSTDNLSGLAGGVLNIQGEEQKKLDVIANRIMKVDLPSSHALSLLLLCDEIDALCII